MLVPLNQSLYSELTYSDKSHRSSPAAAVYVISDLSPGVVVKQRPVH